MKRVLVTLALLLSWPAWAESRYDELKRVVDRNTGFAHMTRGVNMFTLIALRSCVADGDIPVLAQMLHDRDQVMRLAAAFVLVDMGAQGRAALEQEVKRPADLDERLLLQDALRDAASPNREPLKDYVLTERERSLIKGCAKKP
ncbi:MAG TPA: hypothetical protein VMQ51_16015 [Candidatus Binatia bacterium]|nr:hypothetical protein [Candidatus Binatia bacterium]